MRDIRITIQPGETSHQQVALRAWLVRSIETDDVVRLVTQEQGELLLHAGQQVELDDQVRGFELINTSAAPVQLHLQVAGKASIGSKKNGADGGVDQVARDAAAAAASAAAAAMTELADDGAPALGGDLDLSGNEIVSSTGKSLSFRAENGGYFRVNYNFAHFQFRNGNAPEHWSINTRSNGAFDFANQSTDPGNGFVPGSKAKLTIRPDGKVGVGVGDPVEMLDVAGRVKAHGVRLTGVPSTPAGLAAGDVWNDGGTLKIV